MNRECKLAGNESTEDQLMQLMGSMRRAGNKKPIKLRVNYDDFADMVRRLGAKVQMSTTEPDANGWEQVFITLHGAFGSVRVEPFAGVERAACCALYDEEHP